MSHRSEDHVNCLICVVASYLGLASSNSSTSGHRCVSVDAGRGSASKLHSLNLTCCAVSAPGPPCYYSTLHCNKHTHTHHNLPQCIYFYNLTKGTNIEGYLFLFYYVMWLAITYRNIVSPILCAIFGSSVCIQSSPAPVTADLPT